MIATMQTKSRLSVARFYSFGSHPKPGTDVESLGLKRNGSFGQRFIRRITGESPANHRRITGESPAIGDPTACDLCGQLAEVGRSTPLCASCHAGEYPHPHRVDYELDLSTWRYRVKETFCNNDPYAESEISYAQMEYEVRRSPAGQWEVRLLGRNGFFYDTPEAWEAAPGRFLNAWEQAWADRQMSDDRT